MANEVGKVLILVVSKVTTSKTKERSYIFKDLLYPVIECTEYSELVVKALPKIVAATMHQYNDSGSRRLVLDAISKILKCHKEAAVEPLVDMLSNIAEVAPSYPSASISASFLVPLKWSCIVVKYGFPNSNECDGPIWKKLAYVQCVLLSAVMSNDNKKVRNSGLTCFHNVLKTIPGIVSKYFVVIGSAAPSPILLCAVGELFSFSTKAKDFETLQTYKKSMLDLYVTTIFAGKVRQSTNFLRASSPFVQHIKHHEFKGVILPVVQKSLLRNPEVVVEAITHLFKDVSIDLSQHASVLCKSLTAHLHAKDELIRQEVASCIKNLSQQCSNPTAIKDIIEQLFAVLSGSEGRLTVWTDRVGVLKGIGNVERNAVSGSSSLEDLSTLVLKKMGRFLEQEVNENVVVEALSVLRKWCVHFINEVPSGLFTMFQKGMTNKKSSSTVRSAYLHCIATACRGNTLSQAMAVVPQLLHAVERASSQTHQPTMICEGLTAASVLVQLAQTEVQLDSKLNVFWSVLFDTKKKLFTSPKFLATATNEVLEQIHGLLEKLVANHEEKLDIAKAKFWYGVLVFTMTHSNHQVRRNSKACYSKLCSLAADGGQELQSVLLEEFRELLRLQELGHCLPAKVGEDRDVTNGKVEMGPRTSISSKILKSAMECLVLVPFKGRSTIEPKRVERIVLSILEDVHHPSIARAYPLLWKDLILRLNLNGEDLIANNKERVFEMIMARKNQKVVPIAVQTLIKVAENVIFDDLMKHVIKTLKSPEFLLVTREEYGIFQTPEGMLYDNAKINEIKFGESVQHQNMKRESKAYSYEEQLQDIELKKELKKKKKKNDQDPSKKQLEAKQAQLEKEKDVRTRVKEMDDELQHVCLLAKAAVTSNCMSLKGHITGLIQCTTSLFVSPLAAPRVVPVFLAIGEVVFSSRMYYLGKRLGFLTLRLLDTQCELEVDWEEQFLLSAVDRMISDLHDVTVPPEIDNSLELTRSLYKGTLRSTTFSFCFPFLRCVLKQQGSAVKTTDEIQLKAAQVLSEHCRLRMDGDGTDEEYSETGPNNLPRAEMLTLLSEIVQSHSDSVTGSKLQHIACTSMVELSKAASGNEGCTVASDDEIDVLLYSLQSEVSNLRYVAIQCLQELANMLPSIDPDSDSQSDFVYPVVLRIWVAKFDVDEETSKLAERLWQESGYFIQGSICSRLVNDVTHKVDDIQKATSRALTAALAGHKQLVGSVLEQLIEMYKTKSKIPEVKKDSLGRIIGDPYQDPWKERRGIALALKDVALLFTNEEVSLLFSFFVPTGLGDRNEEVRAEMLSAALAAVNHLGKENINSLLTIFEEFLDVAPDSSSHDAIRQSVIILMGCLARHLDKANPKVHPIVVKLLSALSTPSQQVQEAVAHCLPPLVPAIKDEAPEIMKNLLTKLLDSTVYGERRGAAYGLAGIVKGLGILSLKQQNIMSTLQDAIQDKKNYRHREGALFAFELLCHMLGRLFEPYIVHVLPHLLLCFGDGNQFVRDATDDTARAMMRNLSAHGVKLVLPSLLKALEEDSWRTKTGSVELLGAMAYCAPKQLSSCLPSIVPRLTEVLTDSHLKVQKAGAQALKHIGSVIRNPEIQAIAPTLLEALSDPSTKTTQSLQVLLNTSFVHVIDAPSLALIMPIIHRALNARSTETKKMAAQIIGNMYSLTDQKDLNPYLSSVIPGLKQALLDPVPEVRAVSARALGALVKEVGEEKCEDILPWLMDMLTSEGSSVDRSGAAQGLSEVLYGLGFERLAHLMPDVISTTEKSDLAAHVKEGYLMLYLYLPSTFGAEFTPFIGAIIPSILKGLSDESEFVRDTSLKAGQRIVSQYASTAIEVLLPQLEQGLFDENWRIRISSIQLLGDLLYKISGVTGKMTTEGEEDDNFGTSHSNQAIIESLGYERRNRVLSGLYMGRSDVSLPVRQSALHVWKVVVPNTPRILREILPTLFTLLLGCLASTSHDKRQIAARTLGDLVRKLGERILPEIIPILEKGLKSPKNDERQGVCIGLSEIIGSTSKEQVLLYVDSIVPTVRKALCDPLPEVRESAAQTFNNLYRTIGTKALNDIIPDLLEKLSDSELHENALDGLRQVMAVRSKEVLPFIIPQLITPPVNTQALASLSSVAGEALTDHLNNILPALLLSLSSTQTDGQASRELEFARTLVVSVQDDRGSQIVLEVLMKYAKDDSVSMRKAAVTLLCSFCTSTKADISQFISTLLHSILLRFNDSDLEVVEISWNALSSVTKRLDPSQQIQQIPHVRRAIRYATDDIEDGELPGFCLLKKGITPLLPIFREGILNGTPDVKQDAAEGLGEAIRFTSATALKPSVVNITGPLIRILGDRFSWNVKVAVLKTLGLLLDKVGAVLKPFLPQLQTTFIKALNDPNKLVRQQASSALQRLIKLHSRVDPLFTELHNGIKNTDDNSVRETMLQALRGVLISVGSKMGESVRANVSATLLALQGHAEEIVRIAAGGCLGGLGTFVPDDELVNMVNDDILVSDPTVDWTLRHGRSSTLMALFYDCTETLVKLPIFQPLVELAVSLSTTDRIPICRVGIKCLAYAATGARKANENIPAGITTALVKALHHSSVDVKVLACDSIYYISKTSKEIDRAFFKPMMPELLLLSREKNTSIKTASEIAILSLLNVEGGESVYQEWLDMLDSTSSCLLADLYKKSFNKFSERNETVVCELDNPFSTDM